MGYEDFSGKNFSLTLSAGAETPERESAVLACGEQDCSWGELNLFSDFLQVITARAVPFRPPQSKSRSLEQALGLLVGSGLINRDFAGPRRGGAALRV
jgi:hypothetical protein